MSLNRVIISGNIGGAPELRRTSSDMPVLSFSIAVNDRIKNNQTGEWEDRPNWVGVVIFGSRAESLSKILTKGMKVSIDGKLRQNKWEKDGRKHDKLEVIAEDVDLPVRANQANQPSQSQPAAPQHNQPAPDNYSVYDSDIPF